MASINLSRRGFLGHTAGAFTAISLGTGATVALSDPMLDLIQRYRAQLALFDATPTLSDETDEILAEETYRPFYTRLIETPPPITTNAGAVAALREAFEDGMFGNDLATSMVAATLAYLETQAT